MSKKIVRASIAAAASMLCATAFAQTSSVTLYGDIDMYLNYMKSSNDSSTNTIKSVNDGMALRSRIGFKGLEELSSDLAVKFQLESGLSADTGAQADSTGRFFDRQAWVGVASKSYGEFRVGRQNGIVFGRGDYIDFTSRTLGSMVNNFGTPSRYDNDLSYQSPRMSGLMLEGHLALAETTAGATKQAIYQLGADYLNGPFRLGYADITGKAPTTDTVSVTTGTPAVTTVYTTVKKNITYRNLYANYDYGQGKVYAVFIRSNNSTSSGSGATKINNGAAILSNVGGLVVGNLADANRYYNIWQLSADYNVTPQLRVGALWGQIKGGDKAGAKGGAIGAYYTLSKRTTLTAMLDTVSNETNGGFRPSGSAGVSPNFTNAADVNGKRINGIQTGIIHRF
jgi:predicted porin